MNTSLSEALLAGSGIRIYSDSQIPMAIEIAYDALSNYFQFGSSLDETKAVVESARQLHEIAMMHILCVGTDAFLIFALDMKDASNVCSPEGVKTYCCCITNPSLSYFGTTIYGISNGTYVIRANALYPVDGPWA